MAMDGEMNAARLERLSALVDGELDDAAAAAVCGQWHDSVQVRASWHVYQVIGDVLRSDDLACDAGRDAAFLAAFRVRMASEPVVFAPERAAATPHGRWSWRIPTVAAAGFVAVAGVLVLLREAPPMPAGAGLALVGQPLAGGLAVAGAALPVRLEANEPAPLVADGQLIRDARLDRYLAAHKQFAGSSALGVPSAFLRNATATDADR